MAVNVCYSLRHRKKDPEGDSEIIGAVTSSNRPGVQGPRGVRVRNASTLVSKGKTKAQGSHRGWTPAGRAAEAHHYPLGEEGRTSSQRESFSSLSAKFAFLGFGHAWDLSPLASFLFPLLE